MERGEIKIDLDNVYSLKVFSMDKETLSIVTDAFNNNEATHQIYEALSYDFEFNDKGLSFKKHPLVKTHSSQKHLGRIEPNIYVGTLNLDILKSGEFFKTIALEVRSLKTNYRNDYRFMLEEITEACTDLLMQVDSPVTHSFEPDFEKDYETLYQRFTFLKSILDTDDFREAIQRIINYPVTKWNEYEEEVDIRRIRRFSNKNIKDLLKGSNRTPLPNTHSLYKLGVNSVPQRISSYRKVDSVDTPENRFVKYALEYFLYFIVEIKDLAKQYKKNFLEREAILLENELEFHLSHELFKDVSTPKSLSINSPALQRKEGYREVLRVWLMIDLAAKLTWEAGEDIYESGQKNVAVVYEYWLFFKLLNLFEELFDIESDSINQLIDSTDTKLSLKLKEGRHTPIRGIYNKGSRKLNIQFSYNRTFSGDTKRENTESNYPQPGSWTLSMRPDYTLSIWPFIDESYTDTQAETDESIVHIHFDAKYKINNLTAIIPTHNKDKEAEELDKEKEENLKGNFKNADILKMHAYKDAIRRTSGAYVLYPGDNSKELRGFHEIQPGLGAFAISPTKTDTGISDLKDFVERVINHLENRLSQSEFDSYKRYKIYKKQPDIKLGLFNDLLPEYSREENELLEDTKVLVGYIRSPKHRKFYEETNIYNFRTDDKSNKFIIDTDFVSAKYLVLREKGKTSIDKIYEIKGNPEMVSKDFLISKGYPSPSKDSYIIFHIEETKKFGELYLEDFKKLPEHIELFGEKRKSTSDTGAPFTCTLRSLLVTAHAKE